MSGELDQAGRRHVYLPPEEFEGRVRDRGNPAPLDHLSPAAVAATEVVALGLGVAVGIWLATYGIPVWLPPVLFGIIALVLVARVRDVSLLGRLSQRLRRTRADTAAPEPLSVDLPDGASLGVISDGRHLISVLELREDSPTIVIDGTRQRPLVPIGLLVDNLSRYDITLHSIDVTTSSPQRSASDRTAWVTLRFDPARDPGSVERRGGGDRGAVQTLVTVTRRLALRLGGEGLAVTALDASAIARDRARFTVAEGTGVATVVHPDKAATANSDHTDSAAGTDSAAATATAGITWISLRGRDRAGRVHWCAAVTAPPGAPAPRGTRSLDPRAIRGLAAMTPGASYSGPDDTGPVMAGFRPLLDSVERVAAWSPVLGGRGPLLGVDTEGRGVRLGLRGSARHVSMTASRDTVRQLLLRLLRDGVIVEIITEEPVDWEQLRLPDHRLILRDPGERGVTGEVPDLVVVDGTTAPHDRDATILTVTPDGAEAPRAPITIVENHGAATGSVTVTTDGRRLDVGLVGLAAGAGVSA